MKTVAFFVRDEGTTIPAIAVQLKSDDPGQQAVLRRAGLGSDSAFQVLLVRADDGEGSIDPHKQGNSMHCAHLWVEKHFDQLEDGMDLDVESYRDAAARDDYSWLNDPAPRLKDAATR